MNKPAQAAIEAGDLHLALSTTIELKLSALDNADIAHWYYLDKDERAIRELINVARNSPVVTIPALPDRLRVVVDSVVDWVDINRDALAIGVSLGGLVIALFFAVAYPVGQ